MGTAQWKTPARSTAFQYGAALALLAAACGTNNHHPEAGPVAADTARGTVEVVGAEPMTWVSLRTEEGQLPLSGPAAESLRRASGAEVWVSGSRGEDGRLQIEAFRVRSVDGVQATDGILEVDGDAVVLVTADGDRVRYAPAAAALRALEGRRVWIAGRPGAEPQSWGRLDA
jgi:hypothetical protein